MPTRQRGAKRDGSNFESDIVGSVWMTGIYVSGEGQSENRRDVCGALMIRGEYGNTNSAFGWEIDHIEPVALGGSDDLSNLEPLQWENNRGKGDDYPEWECAVFARASGPEQRSRIQ